jgi:hypothetical protein
MIERRSLCMAQIACWRAGTGVAEDLTEKARQLLTRHWSTSSWRGRAHILRTAEWLLGISKGAEAALASLHEIGNSSPVPPPRRLRSLKERSHDVDLADSR